MSDKQRMNWLAFALVLYAIGVFTGLALRGDEHHGHKRVGIGREEILRGLDRRGAVREGLNLDSVLADHELHRALLSLGVADSLKPATRVKAAA